MTSNGGRHRRPRNSTASRWVRAAGVTGAGAATPLLGTLTGLDAAQAAQHVRPAATPTPQDDAAGAGLGAGGDTRPAAAGTGTGTGNDVTRPATAAPRTAPAEGGVVPASTPSAQGGRGAALTLRTASATVHVVVPGDTLSGIAAERGVSGGWAALYERNRSVIGRNPNLIFPGQRLELTVGGAPRQETPASAEPAEQPEEAPERVSDERPSRDDADRAAEEQRQEEERRAEEERQREEAERQEEERRREEEEARRREEEERAAAEAAAAAQAPQYVAPVSGYVLTASFGQSGSRWASTHTGQDFAVPTGTPVKSVAAGTVVFAGWNDAYGYLLKIRHADGTQTWYAHNSGLLVAKGQEVSAGQTIAQSGATGNVTGPHLHFEVRPSGGSPVDPRAWLRARGITI
ncbi:M23 family metallopeptidase [Allostreptomyces psammosilenae]|uniref:Murein DD-endopeptidase MepM/ murein hydrolase activator NlpD n=1 Tax=Allostreptomyces psammosilenae TaxID=1892865 RepID=A0A852ZLG8_9ACTN|nr:M23 family metallopeptidase [Allostreptomyces psammosilenae]NYI03239.1 murein DD-endopeptidase MepM/ murein hydrolase activator NlpD [Allostreptomyces psammosilenae]